MSKGQYTTPKTSKRLQDVSLRGTVIHDGVPHAQFSMNFGNATLDVAISSGFLQRAVLEFLEAAKALHDAGVEKAMIEEGDAARVIACTGIGVTVSRLPGTTPLLNLGFGAARLLVSDVPKSQIQQCLQLLQKHSLPEPPTPAE